MVIIVLTFLLGFFSGVIIMSLPVWQDKPVIVTKKEYEEALKEYYKE